jgi:hypothetical protein
VLLKMIDTDQLSKLASPLAASIQMPLGLHFPAALCYPVLVLSWTRHRVGVVNFKNASYVVILNAIS